MKILLCPDKFKGSLDAISVCNAIAYGLTQIHPELEITKLPLADGGDGTLQVLQEALDLENVIVDTVDPLGRKIKTKYLTNRKDIAYIELAEASGIARLRPSELDVMNANTKGTGLLLNHALESGHKQIFLALGGSCSNDMGIGIAHALGFRFLGREKQELLPSGDSLSLIEHIIPPSTERDFELKILCDVQNPLYGTHGAAHIYARQKGASPKEIIQLDQGMIHFSKIIKQFSGKDISEIKGGGAAGGIAAGLIGLLDKVSLIRGFDFIKEQTKLEKQISNADFVITGEGKFDKQSLEGKVVGELIKICKKYNKPIGVIAGVTNFSKQDLSNQGISFNLNVRSIAQSNKDSIENCKAYLANLSKKIKFH